MPLKAHSFSTSNIDSNSAGLEAGRALMTAFDSTPLQTVIIYDTVNHEHQTVLKAIRSVIGPDPIVVGCSTQGIMSNGEVREKGYLLGVMGLGGDNLNASAAMVNDVQQDTLEKGKHLGRTIMDKLGGDQPKVVIVMYDPLCGADLDRLMGGLKPEVVCPLIGGGAGQPWGPMVKTYQYFDDQVVSHSAIALALSGNFSLTTGITHGMVPTGVTLPVTRAEGNRILEVDGRPALDVWMEMTDADPILNTDDIAAWAVGLPVPDADEKIWAIRAVFGLDEAEKAVVLQASVPEGSDIMLHHRSIENLLDGTKKLGKQLQDSLRDKRLVAALGFECAARAAPFLGPEKTAEENIDLQQLLGPEASWLGMLAWGEIATYGETPWFFNYTFPLLLLSEER
jgi:hypothetical protein